ncbi:hypothetical protein NQ317_016780 [Molorchus minor]|uniref:Leucine-rich repeat and guanylate kinase domain-containing protein n=1 Tax=Molorchus minor TaxID=1323400 RepID=A0ABQ9IYV0_9CUCU|nr:hypothetical protein NQ317_016780 [Molorchus minor]
MTSLNNFLPSSESEAFTDTFTTSGDVADESEVSSNASGFEFDEYSRTFEIVKGLAGVWRTHRFEENPWEESGKGYLQLEDDVTVEEDENLGVLTDFIIGSSLSYLSRSPEDLRHVLCKCVLSNKQLNDISEIRYYHYIQYLDLSFNELTTLFPLGQLPFLQYLDVSHNYLQELLDFKASFYLTFVNFSYNMISVIPDLTQFWSITHMNLSHNGIVEITGLENLRFLSHLDLSYNNIQEIENLNNLRLQYLILHHNEIVDSEGDHATEFKTLHYIRFVDVSDNHLTSLKLFQNAENLESINIANNDIFNLLEVYYLENLRYLSRLNFHGNPIASMKYYSTACLSVVKHLMTLDGEDLTAEQKIEAKKSCEVDASLPARKSHIDLVLLEQINQPYIGPHIVPYNQPPPVVIMLVGLPGSKKKHIVKEFCKINNKSYKHEVPFSCRLCKPFQSALTLIDLAFVMTGHKLCPSEEPHGSCTRKGWLLLLFAMAPGERLKFILVTHLLYSPEKTQKTRDITNSRAGEIMRHSGNSNLRRFFSLLCPTLMATLLELVVHQELEKCINKILVFHGDINSALSLKMMGINPRLVLAVPRNQDIHFKWLRTKYFYDEM